MLIWFDEGFTIFISIRNIGYEMVSFCNFFSQRRNIFGKISAREMLRACVGVTSEHILTYHSVYMLHGYWLRAPEVNMIFIASPTILTSRTPKHSWSIIILFVLEVNIYIDKILAKKGRIYIKSYIKKSNTSKLDIDNFLQLRIIKYELQSRRQKLLILYAILRL